MKGYYREDYADRYLAVLFNEIASYGKGPYQTIYVGGGTPSVLNLRQTKTLLDVLAPMLGKGGEFTFEGNPESIDEEKARLYAAYGVNRVSLGVESFSPRLLKLMGRHHTGDDVFKAVSALRKAGIGNLNLDLIYGLPGETMEELQSDIKALLSFKVPHLSSYSLTVSPHTSFYNKGYEEPSGDASAAFYEELLSTLRQAGYQRYEVSNFSWPGFESRHNLVYWQDLPYVGVGIGAAGYLGGRHYQNTKSLTSYLAQGPEPVYEEEPTLEDKLEYYFLTNLRLAKGFGLEDFAARFGFSFLERYKDKYPKLVEEGLLEVGKNGRVSCTDRGIMLLDRVLVALY